MIYRDIAFGIAIARLSALIALILQSGHFIDRALSVACHYPRSLTLVAV